MKLKKHLVFSVLLLLITTLHVAAQDASGKFTLTHEARWGTAVLPAGSYSATVHSGPVPYVLVSSLDRNAVSIMAVANYIESASCKTSSLQLEQNEGKWDVRSLCLESSLAAFFGKAAFFANRTERAINQRPAAAQVASLATAH